MTSKRDKFREREYRGSYAESFLDTSIATQIRVIREQRGWTQAQLAEAAGMLQSRISALENANYSKWSIGTLKRLARAFDVPLNVAFGTFGSLLADINAFGRKSLERASFDDDPAFGADATVTDSVTTIDTAFVITQGTKDNLIIFPSRTQSVAVTSGETFGHTIREAAAK